MTSLPKNTLRSKKSNAVLSRTPLVRPKYSIIYTPKRHNFSVWEFPSPLKAGMIKITEYIFESLEKKNLAVN